MIEEVCECGDWKSDHLDGLGKCRVCGDSRAPYDGCTKYRYAHVEYKIQLDYGPNLDPTSSEGKAQSNNN